MTKTIRLAKHTTKIGSGQTPSGGYRAYSVSGIPLIRSQNVLMGSFNENGLVFISKEIDEAMSVSRVQSGDVLLNITGASIGRVCVVPDHVCPANVNQHVCIIRCNETLVPSYVATLLASPALQSLIWDRQAGGTRQALTKQMVENFEIPWMSRDEQIQVSARLSAQLSEFETARQAARTQLREISSLEGAIVKEAIPESVGDAGCLGDVLLDIQAGKSFLTAEVLARPDELGVLKVSALSWGDFNPAEAKSLLQSYEPDKRHFVSKGDFLISRANTLELVGAVVLVDRDYPHRLLSDKTLRLVLNEDLICKDYLLVAMRTPAVRKHIEANATGTSDSMRNIAQPTIYSIPLRLPSLSEQRAIAKRVKAQLSQVDAIRCAALHQLAEIDLLPQKILAQAFEM